MWVQRSFISFLNTFAPFLQTPFMVETNHDTDTIFQAFRSETDRREVLIPAVRHPVLGELYVIWTDITDCFPRASRIQHDDEFIPFLRDDNLVR